MKCRRSWFIVLGISLPFGGCNSTGVGNPIKEGSLLLSIASDDEPTEPAQFGNAGASAGGCGCSGDADFSTAGGARGDCTGGDTLPKGTITRAQLVFEEIRLQPCDEGATSHVALRGPITIELMRAQTPPELATIQVPPGGFCGIEAPLQDGPAELHGPSVVLEGRSEEGLPFIVHGYISATLRARSRSGFRWDGVQLQRAFWALRPRRWLARTELERLSREPRSDDASVIVIDRESDPLLYLRFRVRLAGSSTVYGDLDRDGLFSSLDCQLIIGDGLFNAD